jgi:hypothetical protein
MSVLLCHVKEEAEAASVLKEWIESSLDRDVLVHGEEQAIRLDDQRLAQVDRAFNDARVVVLLCSEQSIRRPWVGFEAGCAWIKRVPVVAVCHSGCVASDLPPLLAGFPAFQADDPASCQALLETLAGHLRKARVPRVNVDLMVDELRTAVGRGEAPGGSEARPDGPAAAAMPAASGAALQPIDLRLLVIIKRHDDFTCTAPILAAALEEQERTVRRTLERLANSDLLTLRASTNPTDPDTRYALTDKGRSYLARNAA